MSNQTEFIKSYSDNNEHTKNIALDTKLFFSMEIDILNSLTTTFFFVKVNESIICLVVAFLKVILDFV